MDDKSNCRSFGRVMSCGWLFLWHLGSCAGQLGRNDLLMKPWGAKCLSTEKLNIVAKFAKKQVVKWRDGKKETERVGQVSAPAHEMMR